MNLYNNVFMTIPIIFDYKKLQIQTDEEKQVFIDKFLKDVVNVPLTTKQGSNNNKVIGVIIGGEQTEDYSVKLFALSIINIISEFSQIPTTQDNSALPLAERIEINNIDLDFETNINKKYFDFVNLQKTISQRMEDIVKNKGEK